MSYFGPDPGLHHGTWMRGKQTVTGWWLYRWGNDSFSITLDSTDPVTGQQRHLTVYGETPEWGRWKLAKEVQE